MSGALVNFYRLDNARATRTILDDLRSRQPGHSVRFWRPSLGRPFPPGKFDPKLASYSVMKAAGWFDTPDYGAVLVERHDGRIDHRAMIMPRFARFPFMMKRDLQIGATFTLPEARGQGLALRGVLEVVNKFAATDRVFWYLTDNDNLASVAVIERAGFTLAGVGGKRARYGLQFFGFYDMGRASRGAGVE